EGVDAVVHCAARVARSGNRADFFRDNVSGTAHLLAAAKAAGVKRFVHVSSIGVYGVPAKATSITEQTAYDPHPARRGAYTRSKTEADGLVQEFARKTGLSTLILRPGILVGPGGPEFTARLCLGRFGGRVVIVGRRKARLPLCHVADAARAAALAVTARTTCTVYNLVDEGLTQEEWLRQPAGGRGGRRRAGRCGRSTCRRPSRSSPPSRSRWSRGLPESPRRSRATRSGARRRASPTTRRAPASTSGGSRSPACRQRTARPIP